MAYRVFSILPFYLLGVDWAMWKILIFFELSQLHFLIDTIFDMVGSTLTKIFFILPYSIEATSIKSFQSTIAISIVDIFLLAHSLTCFWIRFNYLNLDHNLGQMYTNALYFIIATASTVGYGDQTVNKNQDKAELRYLFTFFLVFLALIFFAYMQSLINTIIAKLNKLGSKSQEAHSELEDWLVLRNKSGKLAMPFVLEKKISRFFKFKEEWDLQNILFQYDLYYKNSIKMQQVISDYTVKELCKKFHTFFDEIPPIFRTKLALMARLVK